MADKHLGKNNMLIVFNIYNIRNKGKLYTGNHFKMETSIVEFNEKFHIADIKTWNLICHMHTSWVNITAEKKIIRRLSEGSLV